MTKISKPRTRVIYRDAETGQIVTKAFAKKNPKTTVKETIKP